MKKILIVFLLLVLYSLSFAGHKGDSLGNKKGEFEQLQSDVESLAAGALGYYLTDETPSSVGYWLMQSTVSPGAESTITADMDSATVVIGTFTTESQINFTSLRAGFYNMFFYADKSTVNRDVRIRFEVYSCTGTAETFLFSSEQSNLITTDKAFYTVNVATNEIIVNGVCFKYLAIRVVADVTGAAAAPTLTFYMEGSNGTFFSMPSAALTDIGVTRIIAGNGTDIEYTGETSGRGDVTVNATEIKISTGNPASVVGFTDAADFKCDGVADEVQINAALALGGAVELQPGATFTFTNDGSNISMTIPHTTLIGNKAVIRMNGSGNDCLNIDANDCRVTGVIFSPIDIDNGQSLVDIAIGVSGTEIDHCEFRSSESNGGAAIYCDEGLRTKIHHNIINIDTAYSGPRMIVYVTANTYTVEGLSVNDNYIKYDNASPPGVIGGIYFDFDGVNESQRIVDNDLYGCNIYTTARNTIIKGNTIIGIVAGTDVDDGVDVGANDCIVVNNFVSSCSAKGIQVDGNDNLISGNRVNNLGATGIAIDSGNNNLVIGNDTEGCTTGYSGTAYFIGNVDSDGTIATDYYDSIYLLKSSGTDIETNTDDIAEIKASTEAGNLNNAYNWRAGNFTLPSQGFSPPYLDEYDMSGTSYPVTVLVFSSSTDNSAFIHVKMDKEYNGGNPTYYVDYLTPVADSSGQIEFNIERSTTTNRRATIGAYTNTAFGDFPGSIIAYEVQTATLTITANKPVADKQYWQRLWIDVSDSTVVQEIYVIEVRFDYVKQ